MNFGASPVTPADIGTLAMQAIRSVIQNPLFGTTILHFQSQRVDDSNFNADGKPDYLAADPGLYASGVTYTANPNNPLKGVFCPAPRRPIQEAAGIFYQGQFELYLLDDLGEVYSLDDRLPKKQDAFEIFGRRYYAAAPVMPCTAGDVIGCYKVELSLERYPVRN